VTLADGDVQPNPDRGRHGWTGVDGNAEKPMVGGLIRRRRR
jgi:hypothetical protein